MFCLEITNESKTTLHVYCLGTEIIGKLEPESCLFLNLIQKVHHFDEDP